MIKVSRVIIKAYTTVNFIQHFNLTSFSQGELQTISVDFNVTNQQLILHLSDIEEKMGVQWDSTSSIYTLQENL
jgi:hypothetical protein